MSEQPTFKDVLRKNRRALLAVLMLPVFGMIIAILLIVIRVPEKLFLSGGVIILLMCQYLILVVYVSQRIDRLISS